MVKDWSPINLSKNSKIKARIGWQGLTTAEYLDEGYAYLITGTDFVSGRIDWSHCHFVTYERYLQDQNIQIENGDLLLSKDGTIGKVALVANLNRPATLNSGVFLIRPTTDTYLTKYMFYVLESFIFKNFLGQLSAGSTINHLYQKDIVKFECLLPPIREQEHIANALGDIDETIEGIRKKLIKYKELRKGCLQDFFPKYGCCTPNKRFPEYTAEWKRFTFDDIAIILSGARVHKDEWTKSGVPFFRSSDVMAALNGESNENAFISEELYEKLSAISGKLEKGDILITGGGSIGNPYIVPNDKPLYTKDADLLWVKRNKNIDPYFMYTFFFTPAFREYLLSISHVGTIAHYTIEQLKKTSILIPEFQEQVAIGEFFMDIDETIKLLQQKIRKYEDFKQGMMEELLTGKVRLV